MSRRQNPHSRLYRMARVFVYRKRYVLVICLAVLGAMIGGVTYVSRSIQPYATPQPRTWSEIKASDTLRAVTIQSCFTAFRSNGKWYGHEYNNALAVANGLGLGLKVLLVKSEQELADSLFSGAADVAIWPMSYSVVADHWYLRPTGPRWADSQCIASAQKLKLKAYQDTTLTDSMVALLPHYQLSLLKDSRQWRVWNDDSVRAHFDLRPYVLDTIAHDSLNNEYLTDSMIEGRTDAVMLRCNVARLMHDYYPSLVLSDTIPFSQDSVAWMVANTSDTLRHLIDSVTLADLRPGTPHYIVGPNQYRDQKLKVLRKAAHFKLKDGAISPYDDIFRRHGKAHDIDWRLLAGIAFIESNFQHNIVSHRGPIGLMQLMPATVRMFERTETEALDPDVNVELASLLYSKNCDAIRKRLPGIDDENLRYMALAGYNAGLGHVFDAISLAETLGYNPNVWSENVEHCLRLKREPKYYKMDVVKQGKFNGAFTINYVTEVMTAYHSFCEQTK